MSWLGFFFFFKVFMVLGFVLLLVFALFFLVG